MWCVTGNLLLLNLLFSMNDEESLVSVQYGMILPSKSELGTVRVNNFSLPSCVLMVWYVGICVTSMGIL